MPSYFTWAVIAALLNLKVLPLMFHVRFYYYVAKNMFVKHSQYADNVYKSTVIKTFTPFLEMDLYLHKSNSTYFSDMDISRTDLMTTVLKRFYQKFNDPDLPPLKPWQFIYSPLGSTNMVFRKEIKGYTPYEVKSFIIGWTNKWLFVLSVFQSAGGKTIYAYGLSKYVLKQGRKTISPQTAIEFCGLLTPQAIEKNKAVQKYLQDSLDLEDIIKLAD